jgi:hypothetical protein
MEQFVQTPMQLAKMLNVNRKKLKITQKQS